MYGDYRDWVRRDKQKGQQRRSRSCHEGTLAQVPGCRKTGTRPVGGWINTSGGLPEAYGTVGQPAMPAVLRTASAD